jgi:hypothetical protein
MPTPGCQSNSSDWSLTKTNLHFHLLLRVEYPLSDPLYPLVIADLDPRSRLSEEAGAYKRLPEEADSARKPLEYASCNKKKPLTVMFKKSIVMDKDPRS